MTPRNRTLAVRLKPSVTAVVAGGLAGTVALLTYQGMMALQHLVWPPASDGSFAAPLRIFLTIILGGILLLLLTRIEPSESVNQLLRDANRPLGRSPRKIAITALAAIVSVAFGGAIGPEAGLLAVVAECAVIVSAFIARDEAQARAIAQAGAAGVMGGLYGSPPAAAAITGDGESLAPSRLMSFVAGISGFLAFTGLSHAIFDSTGLASIPLPEPGDGTAWLLIVPVLVGVGMGVLFRWLHHGANRLASQIARPWVVTIIGTVLFAALSAAIPLVLFSGHHEITEVIDVYSSGETGALWILALAKIIAVVLCLVARWRGGEIFPLVFVGAAAGAATALMLPGVDPAGAMAGAMAATLAVGWRRPLATLLVLVLVLDSGMALPLLLGVGVGAVVDKIFFAAPEPREGSEKHHASA
ncbi:chloride channel protein [Glutamicibacter sp.]|uniref:chloride channel protein n=1 Tax=Glutamicibacter sp. TaxID=1931995 RepID=UPI0028BF30EF|nr:chloride channel protein [Glutamicibacter sp.]